MINSFSAWLAGLKIGDPVIFHSPIGNYPAVVSQIDAGRIWVKWRELSGEGILSWCHQDTGNCPSARTFISPMDDIDDEPDNRVGGWEAA